MPFIINTKYRIDAVEMMDDFSMDGELLLSGLDQIAAINKWLGGNRVVLSGIRKILASQSKDKSLTIVDLGCGGGDMLRKVADYGQREGYKFRLIGIDANHNTINYAKRLSEKYQEISYLQQDIFSEEFKNLSYDVVLATLFLHHFNEKEIVNILKHVRNKARLGVIINDLHRHPIAYYLFRLLSLGIKNKMIKHDGLTSILRGFKKEDLKRFSKQLKAKSQIEWKWAFRYQWIMQK